MAFMTLKRLFEPKVMFLGLTNSLTMFQTIMNKILWDLINTGEVVSFIDNIIVGTEECYKISVWTDFRVRTDKI